MKLPNWISAAIAAIATALPGLRLRNLQEIKPGVTTPSSPRAKMGNPGFDSGTTTAA
jgi:hypothetical protein